MDKVVVLWTANTERYSNLVVGLNDTTENLLAALDRNEAEISPSTLFAIACVTENVPFINGSPQNTFVPGWMLTFLVSHNLIVLIDAILTLLAIRVDWFCHPEKLFDWRRWLQEWSDQNEIRAGRFPCGGWYQGISYLYYVISWVFSLLVQSILSIFGLEFMYCANFMCQKSRNKLISSSVLCLPLTANINS